MGIVPVVSAVMGTAAGGPSGARDPRALVGHGERPQPDFRRRSAGGRARVRRTSSRRKSSAAHKMAVDTAGTIDNAAEDEADCLRQIRRFLSYMPSNVWELPPRRPCDDPVDRCEDALAEHRAALAAPGLQHEEADRNGGRPRFGVRNPADIRPRGDHRPRAHERHRRRHRSPSIRCSAASSITRRRASRRISPSCATCSTFRSSSSSTCRD